jgi:hypothetical protein
MKGITRAAMAAVNCIILGGCTTAMAPPLTPIVPAETCVIERNYTAGKRQTAYVGQSMVKVVEKNVRQKNLTMSPLADFRMTGTFSKKLLFDYAVSIAGSKTGRYPLIGSMRIDGSTYYVVDMQDTRDTSYAVLIGLDNKLTERYLLNDDHDYLMPALGATLVPGEVTFALNGDADDADPSNTVVRYGTTNFELIYRGVNKVAMEMTFREYTPDYRDDPSLFEALQSGIRKVINEHPDAFGQSLAYPLGTATVTVKNLKIRIHEATDDRIVYTVLDDGLKD